MRKEWDGTWYGGAVLGLAVMEIRTILTCRRPLVRENSYHRPERTIHTFHGLVTTRDDTRWRFLQTSSSRLISPLAGIWASYL